MTSTSNGLYLDGLAMRFGGVQVFDNVTMHIPPAQVTACIGPNGAGKTTLINVVCGVFRAHGGRVFLDGNSLDGIHPHDIGDILGKQQIAVRVGHHCAMPLMRHLGLIGTTRASFGMYNTSEDVDKLVAGIQEVKKVFA